MVRQSTGRKRDAARTKASILEAATSEFSLRGPAGTRVDEIAARAGVNKSLIYQYFGSKQELYAEALNAALGTITTKSAEFTKAFSAATSPTDMRGMIHAYLENHLSMLELVPEYPRLIAWENLEGGRTLGRLPVQHTYREFLTRISKILDPLRDRGLLREDFDVKHVAQAVMALTHYFIVQKGTLRHLFETDPTTNEARDAWVDWCASLMLAALRPPDPTPNA